MAYSELIKNFEKVRDYMREFYVYGFKRREEYDAKSARSYDNERRRVESWLGEYMSFRQDANGKSVFLSVDSRAIGQNPLYRAFKAKSFTDNDILLHFYILDTLADGSAHSAHEIIAKLAEYLLAFDTVKVLDDSTVRKKLKEYEKLGLLCAEKQGRELTYRLSSSEIDTESWREAAAFFSEADPLGVVGSFLLDKFDSVPEYFGFKHHYILHALDSQILCTLSEAIREQRQAELCIRSRRVGQEKIHFVYPLRLYISTQTGRQYLLSWHYGQRRMLFFRVDSIHSVTVGKKEAEHARFEGYYAKFREHLWGVSVGVDHSMDHLEMTLHVGDGEGYIVQRLDREKRNGRIEIVDEHTYRFVTDVYDASEMLPWIRSFIGRIVSLQCSNAYVMRTFQSDLKEMQRLYGGETDAL